MSPLHLFFSPSDIMSHITFDIISVRLYSYSTLCPIQCLLLSTLCPSCDAISFDIFTIQSFVCRPFVPFYFFLRFVLSAFLPGRLVGEIECIDLPWPDGGQNYVPWCFWIFWIATTDALSAYQWQQGESPIDKLDKTTALSAFLLYLHRATPIAIGGNQTPSNKKCFSSF